MPQGRFSLSDFDQSQPPLPPAERGGRFTLADFEEEPPKPSPAPSAGMGEYARRVRDRLNPIAAAQAFGRMVIPESAARAMGAGDAEAEQYGPLNTLRNMGQSTQEVFEQAKRAYDAGDYGSAAIKTFFGMIPVLGPDFNQMGNQMREGHVAGALGDATGLGLSLVAPQAVKQAAPAVNVARTRLANAADTASHNKMVQAIVPTVGPNKRKFGNMAATAAPRLARETTAVTRGGLIEEVGTKLDDANDALNAAYDLVPRTRQYPTQAIKDGLRTQIKSLSVAGSGGSVEPATRAARLKALKGALAEVDALGKTTNLENLRKLKASWGEGGKAIYTPDIAADAFNVRAAGHGWADANSVIGDFLSTHHPELKALNADVSLWIKAQDVLEAAEQIERVRPTVGRSIMARGLGAATGGAGAGVPGAITGAIVGPLVERAITNASPAMKVTVSRQLAAIADALRKGNQPKAASLFQTLNKLVPAGAAVQGVSQVSASLPKAAENDRRSPPQVGRSPR